MGFTNTNDYLTGRKPTVTCDCSELVPVRYELVMVAADLTLNNIGAIGILPAAHVMRELYVDADDLDTNGVPTLTLDVGILNAAGTAFDVTFATGLTVGQAGGVVQVLSSAMIRAAATQADRKLGVKVSAAAATAADGKLALQAHYVAA